MTEKKEIYQGAIFKVKEVKHSVVYKNDKLPGIYIPKEVLGNPPYPSAIWITLKTEE